YSTLVALTTTFLLFSLADNLSLVLIFVVTVNARNLADLRTPLSNQVLVDELDNVLLNCSFSDRSTKNNAKWIKNGKEMGSSGRYYINDRDYSLMIRSISIDDEGSYSCEVNSTVVNTVVLKVREKLRFSPIPTNRKLDLGSNSKIHCKVRGFSGPTIKWMKEGTNGKELPTHLRVENGTLYFDDVKSDDSGKYMCIASDGSESINATIQVDIIVMPKFVITPVPLRVPEGDNVTLDCVAEGDPKPIIHWDKNNLPNGFTSSRYIFHSNGTLFITDAQLDDAGKYGCTAGNSGGFKRTEVTLEVYSSQSGFDSSNIADETNMMETVAITLCAVVLYMVLVLSLMIWCRVRRAKKKARALAQSLPDGKSENGDVEMREYNGQQQQQVQTGNAPEERKLLADKGKKNTEEDSIASSSHSSKRSKSPFEKLQYPKQELQTIMLLGHGEFGDVYLAKAPAIKEAELESIVMVKALHSKDESIVTDFRRELEMFHKLDHQKVAKLLGICRDSECFLLLIEYSDWGDLKQFLLATRKENTRRGLKPNPLTISEIISIGQQIASGMEHLTSNRFVHKDLATRNCLITSNLDVKISSTSLSKDTYSAEYVSHRNRDVSARWAPHEAVFEDEWSAKSDVWSYGVLLWEIFNQAELPFADKSDDLVLRQLQAKQLRLTTTSNASEEMQRIMNSCWNESPRNRPEFAQICISFEEMIRRPN
ncbi:inactive tyrosine-protein kinase 7-like protein, partial [Leptotrombidium deliense]